MAVAVNHKARIAGDARFTKSPFISSPALLVGSLAGRVSDISNPPVSKRQQVLHHCARRGRIFNSNRIDIFARVLVVDEHQRHFQFGQLRNIKSAYTRSRNEDPIHAPFLK